MSAETHQLLVYGVLAAAPLTLLVLLFLSAPYGRHMRDGWGPTLPNRWGWILMESPAVLVFSWVWVQGDHAWEPAPLLLLAAWQLHYVHRTFVFPFRLKTTGKRMALLIPTIALVFNSVNAVVNARQASHLGDYGLSQPTLWIGLGVFAVGMAINLHADTVLLNLRKPGETGYKVPMGGLYRFVTCPNYLGEMLEWLGWAVATWSLGGLAFFLYTSANLLPRALQNHRWYRETFSDYPSERRALVPYVL